MLSLSLGLGLGQNVAAQSGGGAAETWASSSASPASSTDWTLSNGNLTALRSTNTQPFAGVLFGNTAKTNGTFIVTVNAIGAGPPIGIGVALSAETQFPGHDVNGDSVGYLNDGSIRQGNGTLATGATWTTADVIKVVKAGVNVSFYKNNVLQATIDTSAPVNGFGTILAGNAYPLAYTQNGTGTQFTADFSAW
jgi:hypothetical protein